MSQLLANGTEAEKKEETAMPAPKEPHDLITQTQAHLSGLMDLMHYSIGALQHSAPEHELPWQNDADSAAVTKTEQAEPFNDRAAPVKAEEPQNPSLNPTPADFARDMIQRFKALDMQYKQLPASIPTEEEHTAILQEQEARFQLPVQELTRQVEMTERLLRKVQQSIGFIHVQLLATDGITVTGDVGLPKD